MRNTWEPVGKLVPNQIHSEDYKMLIDELAELIYSNFCQLQKSNSDLSTRIESINNMTQGNVLPKRTGSDG